MNFGVTEDFPAAILRVEVMMMMRAMRNSFFAICVVMLAASQVSASDPLEVRERKPGFSLAAAGMNLVFLPVRLAMNVLGAELAGVTGFLTLGNQDASGDVASMFDGTQYLSPEHVEGTEAVRFGPPQFP